MVMRRNPIVLAFNIVCLLPKINRKTLEFKLAELPMGGRDAPPPNYPLDNLSSYIKMSQRVIEDVVRSSLELG